MPACSRLKRKTFEAKKIREAVGLPTPPTRGQELGYFKPDVTVTVPLLAFMAVSEFEA
jgi:hypothetical protein